MGKRKTVKRSKWIRTCERCGNETFTPKRIYTCPYCNWRNGLEKKGEYVQLVQHHIKAGSRTGLADARLQDEKLVEE
ncbi:hypothetical protein [Faecalimonas sp.]